MICVIASLQMTERICIQVSCPPLPAENSFQLPTLKRDQKFIHNINTSNDSLLPTIATKIPGELVFLW
jgi:hypothetical protein